MMRILPYRTVDNVIAGVVVTFIDVTKIMLAEERIGELTRDLRGRVQNLERLLDLVPVGILVMDDKESGEIRINRVASELLGQPLSEHALPRASAMLRILSHGRELLNPEQPLQVAARTGAAVSSFEGEILRADGTQFHALMSATPLMNEDGTVRGGIAAILDISERKRAEAHQQVLLHELQHRVKNIITTISALAMRMMKGSTDFKQFTDAFLGRLDGMARTHDLLSRANWQGAGLRELIANMLRSYTSKDGNNIRIEGPDLILEPGTATTLGMVFYELATNAAKYGTLSARGGQIDIQWRLGRKDGKESVSLAWTERGGPAVRTDAPEGFGTSFIKRSVEYEISGHVELELRPSGVHCVIEFPLRKNVPRADRA